MPFTPTSSSCSSSVADRRMATPATWGEGQRSMSSNATSNDEYLLRSTSLRAFTSSPSSPSVSPGPNSL